MLTDADARTIFTLSIYISDAAYIADEEFSTFIYF